MTTVRRKTINLDDADASALAPFLEAESEEHAALERLVGQRLRSDSAELRALVLLGVDRVKQSLLEDAYNAAVDEGDFDESHDWVEQTTAARRGRRTPA